MIDTMVAKTILQQMGGRRFLMMTGCKQLVADTNSLRMKLIPNKSGANYLTITLTPADLYTMTYTKYTRPTKANQYAEKTEVMAEFEGCYCDMIEQNFEDTTGLYTRL